MEVQSDCTLLVSYLLNDEQARGTSGCAFDPPSKRDKQVGRLGGKGLVEKRTPLAALSLET